MQALMMPTSLRTRTLLAIVLMLVLLVGGLLLVADSIIGRSFRAVEDRSVQEHVQQAANAISDDIARIDSLTSDYAQWDDTYTFVTKPTQRYIEVNSSDAIFANINISYIAFVNTAGEIVYARAFNHETQQVVEPPAELKRFDGANARLLQHADSSTHLAGLLVLADGPMLLSAWPILTSKGTGPPTGTLLMGRWLDAREVARLTASTRLPLTVTRLDDSHMAANLQRMSSEVSAEQPIVTSLLDSQRIIGATQITNLLGGAGVLLHIELPREIFLLGQQATHEYTLALLGACIFFGALVFWMLERTVLARTITLSAQVAAVDVSRPDAQVTITGRDEISQLGGAINQMLGGLAQAQHQIAESELRYRQLIELTPDTIIVHDGRHIRYINPAGARLLGDGTPATSIGQPVEATISGLRPHTDGTPLLVERMLTQPDGMTIEAELIVLPFRDRDTPAIQVVVRNITERKQVEQALRTAKEAADAANRAKSYFLATMSHELRTPLTAIIGYAELLDDMLCDTASSDVLRDLNRIHSAGTHLLAIINDVLDVSKIEAGRMLIDCAPVTLDPLLQAVTDTILPQAKQNANRFERYGGAAAGVMETDPVHLRQILINLLGNACKFTQAGLVTLTVRVQPDTAGAEQIVFAVSDTGIGMRPDQLGLLFRDFGQIDASTTRKYGGTGLGLALSQRLARLMGGEITVTSAPGVGSTFTLILPRKLIVGATSPMPNPGAALQAASPASVATLATQLVLVIDDDPNVRDLLPRALARADVHFETAASAADGLELAMALLPDLIILDVQLPDFDGWTVLSQLKADPTTHAIPVLMLTIDAGAEQSMLQHVAGVIHKPVELEQLAHKLTALLDKEATPSLVLVADSQGLAERQTEGQHDPHSAG